MTSFILFRNSTDVSINKTICTKTGEAEAYKASVRLFRERKVPCYEYIIIRKDVAHIYAPRVYTNLFSEIKGLGGAPWLFDMKK
jgi:hypothetical protein